MLSGDLLPAHPKPYQNEIFTSWFVRTAHANGIKLHTLSRLILGGVYTPWNKDIDRLAPAWLIEAICKKTGLSREKARNMTLDRFEGVVFQRKQSVGTLRWILPVVSSSTRREGFGMQLCAECLREDSDPYFRVTWRLAFYTFCPKHMVMMFDACSVCGAPIAVHRCDFNVDEVGKVKITRCSACGVDFRKSKNIKPVGLEENSFLNYRKILDSFDLSPKENIYGESDFSVLHQLCKTMLAKSNNNKLSNHILASAGKERREFELARFPLEHRRVMDRFYLISSALWLMDDLASRIRMAVDCKAVRYNLLLRDFHNAPHSYRKIIEKLDHK